MTALSFPRPSAGSRPLTVQDRVAGPSTELTEADMNGRTSTAPIGALDDDSLLAQRHRHGQKLRDLGFGTLDAEGNWEPFPVPLTRMRPTWNGWPWWVLALSAAGLIAWAVAGLVS